LLVGEARRERERRRGLGRAGERITERGARRRGKGDNKGEGREKERRGEEGTRMQEVGVISRQHL
jgi:hypothetical protein